LCPSSYRGSGAEANRYRNSALTATLTGLAALALAMGVGRLGFVYIIRAMFLPEMARAPWPLSLASSAGSGQCSVLPQPYPR